MIVNEEGLEDCSIIANSIHEDGINNFKIVGVIPTSTELIYLLLILILMNLIFIDIMKNLLVVIE